MSEVFSQSDEALQKLLACVLFRGFEKAELLELLEKLRAKEIKRKNRDGKTVPMLSAGDSA